MEGRLGRTVCVGDISRENPVADVAGKTDGHSRTPWIQPARDLFVLQARYDHVSGCSAHPRRLAHPHWPACRSSRDRTGLRLRARPPPGRCHCWCRRKQPRPAAATRYPVGNSSEHHLPAQGERVGRQRRGRSVGGHAQRIAVVLIFQHQAIVRKTAPRKREGPGVKGHVPGH